MRKHLYRINKYGQGSISAYTNLGRVNGKNPQKPGLNLTSKQGITQSPLTVHQAVNYPRVPAVKIKKIGKEKRSG